MGTRREFIKKVGYAAPVVVTMAAKPAFASTGSGRHECQDLQSDYVSRFRKWRYNNYQGGTDW